MLEKSHAYSDVIYDFTFTFKLLHVCHVLFSKIILLYIYTLTGIVPGSLSGTFLMDQPTSQFKITLSFFV
ncbi:hypothetical protein HanRHA438_Chr14g0675151 [Helianthus annuus]|nr:hypothetical protein HanRHA438_Chr14g0675151 [Helianthus annuus]